MKLPLYPGFTTTMFGVITLASCVTRAPQVAPTPLDLMIVPGKFAEKCVAAERGLRVDWRFESTIAVDFNIHTHRQGQVVTPVDVRGTKAHKGSHSVDERGDYCLMWENRSGVPAYVRGDWRAASTD